MQIINSDTQKMRDKKIKMIPEMLNLLGCSKDNFKKLLQNMNYKVFQKDEDTFFTYAPKKIKRKIFNKKTEKESPFGVLKNLDLS